MKSQVVLVASLGSVASAHSVFTTLFVNGTSQGDGTCVRMPPRGPSVTAPVFPITDDVMACGRGGERAVTFSCWAPQAATLTFEFRMHPDGSEPGAITSGHRGPCAVYLMRVEDMARDAAAGPGWFKIWENGYDGSWCVDRLIRYNGLLSVSLPASLPAGYYLVRPKLLTLHNAIQGSPEFYLGCAQIFIPEGPKQRLDIPEDRQVSIPGYVAASMPGLAYNIYGAKPLPPYPMPGPRVFRPARRVAEADRLKQEQGAIPGTCVVNNANWCAKLPVPYTTREGCRAAVAECYKQARSFESGAPPSRDANCSIWRKYCRKIEAGCEADRIQGPPEMERRHALTKGPGPIPKPCNEIFRDEAYEEDNPSKSAASSSSLPSSSISAASTGSRRGPENAATARAAPARLLLVVWVAAGGLRA